jgi:hypothetical protein
MKIVQVTLAIPRMPRGAKSDGQDSHPAKGGPDQKAADLGTDAELARPPCCRETSTALVNGIVTGAGALYQPLVGWFLDLAWKGQMVSGVRVYDAGAYRKALTVLVAGTFLGLLCTLFVRETNCRQSAIE